MGQTALIPAWVVPAAREVADCHWIAHHYAAESGLLATRHSDVLAVLDWVTGDLPDDNVAYQRMHAGGHVGDTIAWLLGMSRIPPVQLPRRNPDGSVVTADQLYAEYMTGKTGLPEQRTEARARATSDAARYRRLAALVPH